MLTLGKTTLPVYTYQLMESRLKGNLAYSLAVRGYDVNGDTFWDTVIDMAGTTYNEYFSRAILETVKEYLISVYLFDEVYGLSLPASATEKIRQDMEDFVTYDGKGSKTALNNVLSAYGVNLKRLEEAYVMEAKHAALLTYLYGEDGALIGDSLKDEYYRAHYNCFKQIVLNNFYLVTATDAEGNEITVDADGDGYADTKEYSAAERRAIAVRADVIMTELSAHEGDVITFEYYMAHESDDALGQAEFTDGYFLSDKDTYTADLAYLTDINEKLSSMAVGEVALVEADDGWHIIRKYDLPDGAYAKDANSPWFSEMISNIRTELYHKLCEQYIDEIEVNELALKNAMDMKAVTPNYYY